MTRIEVAVGITAISAAILYPRHRTKIVVAYGVYVWREEIANIIAN